MRNNSLNFHTRITPAPTSRRIKSETDDHNNFDEKQYILAQNDPDIFGDRIKDDTQDADDIVEENFIENPSNKSRKMSTKQYADIIKDHLQNNRIKEAIDTLEIRMIKEDRVKPENYIFNLLIGGCARVGYSKKAFSLFTKMKQRNLKVTGGTYTSLFNACAMAPWPQDGLTKANRLREIMLEKGYHPNESNYNAMIKAYGRCGDIQTAFQLVDEMKSKDLEIRVQTFNHLLQACASDAQLGFRHALLVWHKMRNRRQIPDVYSFNLMLRCVRDCDMGDFATSQQFLEQLLPRGNEPATGPTSAGNPKQLALSDAPNAVHTVMGNETTAVQNVTEFNDAAPNLLAKRPHLGNLISVGDICKAEDRLLLLGGMHGFVREMESVKAEPTIKTITALLEVIPSTLAAEKNLIVLIRRLNIKCDIDFFNILIKKRSLRFDYDDAKAVLKMINTAGLEPDIVTYGVLALGCTSKLDAQNLLQEMYIKGLRMNIQILGAMVKQGCVHRSFEYVLEIMKIVKDERIKPNEQFLTHLYHFHHHCFRLIQTKVSRGGYNISFCRFFLLHFTIFLFSISLRKTNHSNWILPISK